ncbi:hypothetical protein Aspvir_008410 [Aspergillus viridinutans]|uniref:Aminoglycoside phosphotransferase domain-containing protein n=1 Tax=Aspergillus viridinutans TaxID=75553 RepID=A0A9P3F7E9_ASPVI|nr:uncharacterized protein Aspvir_008410 [Aspergillus viridinutans]GIK04330.1 hypothetical protein Aspvir_008410 [Aspergillus viridinutans]
MTTRIKLLYYAVDLPCQLPTEAEIDEAPNIAEQFGGRRIVAIEPHFVVKFGMGIDLLEGENMIFVRENTSICVPRVYALYTSMNTGKKYIVMEWIPGETLLSSWSWLGLSEKESLPQPSYYGSLGERPLLDGIFWTQEPEPAINGLFTSNEDLIEGMARKYIHDSGPSIRADFLRHCLPRVLCDQRPTFTHGDFQRKNIMLQVKEGDAGGDSAELQVVVLDWEKSGWYLAYWEYCLAYCALWFDNDWCLWVDKALEPFISEAAWLYQIRLELWS